MVRLQLRHAAGMGAGDEAFNPTMVRLQLCRLPVRQPENRLSIPLWCDCNLAIPFLLPTSQNFQSHYGAIATSPSHPSEILCVAPFNPTMVRLQQGEMGEVVVIVLEICRAVAVDHRLPKNAKGVDCNLR